MSLLLIPQTFDEYLPSVRLSSLLQQYEDKLLSSPGGWELSSSTGYGQYLGSLQYGQIQGSLDQRLQSIVLSRNNINTKGNLQEKHQNQSQVNQVNFQPKGGYRTPNKRQQVEIKIDRQIHRLGTGRGFS